MKQLPNLFTLLNLVFGCIAIVYVLQTGETIVLLEESGYTQVNLPEKIWMGSLFIFGAAVIDFLDGFIARAFKAQSPMGEQLDSLSDMVSFGVAPGIILYQLLRIGFAQGENGIETSFLALLPAFIFPCAVAWRLAKFNLSSDQSNSFRGVPSPAAGLVVASFPLIIWFEELGIRDFFIKPWILYAVILLLSYLMLNNHRFLAMKFKDYSFAHNKMKYILVILSIIAIIFLKWVSVPVIFLLYVVFSFLSKDEDTMITTTKKGAPEFKV
jgi:CDP-diacylglycerol--serine O-phosphatidyltransferase